MIQHEFLNNGTLIKQWSDKNKQLLQVETGTLYSEPVDIVPCPYTYEESDIDIEVDEDLINRLKDNEEKLD